MKETLGLKVGQFESPTVQTQKHIAHPFLTLFLSLPLNLKGTPTCSAGGSFTHLIKMKCAAQFI